MSTQIAVKLPETTLAALDRLVANGRFQSRSEAVRVSLDRVLREARAEELDRAFAAGFTRHPERPDELAEAQRLAVDAIEDEPWDRWW